jgi:hypothetical protein
MTDWDMFYKFASILLTLFAIGFTVFTYNIKLKDDLNKMNQETNEKIASACLGMAKDLSQAVERLVVLETQNSLWWDSVKSNVINMLKNMPTIEGFEKDKLLTQFQRNELTLEEAKELREILNYEKDLPEKQPLAWGYVLIIAGLDQKIHDLRKESVQNGQRVDGDC